MRAALIAGLLLAGPGLVGLAQADWVPVMDDPLLVPLDWRGNAVIVVGPDVSIEVVEDELLEPWASERRSVTVVPRAGARQGEWDCVCDDVLTPTDWR